MARTGIAAGIRGRKLRRLLAATALLALPALGGCGVAAAPCRVGSAALDMIPLVGHVAATPTDACADAIDP